MPREPGLVLFLVPQGRKLDYLDRVIILQLPQPLPDTEMLSLPTIAVQKAQMPL